jgi:catechol 2,3-dioxygenase-like lactoylglutathione lyase family enzyme
MGKYSALNITGVLAALLLPQAALAQTLLLSPEPMADGDYDLSLPAVSAPNGKFEIYGGFANPGNAAFRAGASVSLPVGSTFGLQFDGAVQASGAGMQFGGVAHAFTRDPDSYLFGLAGGVVRGPTGTLGVIGVEGELYLDQVSIEAWAGVAGINYDVLPDVAGIFVLADASYYATDDLRLTAGFSHLLGNNGLHLGAEYQLRDWNLPISVTADARFTQNGYSVMAGIKGYFGGDPDKSLKDRHRQDDPPNRALSLFGMAGSLLFATPPTTTPPVCTPTIEPADGDGQISNIIDNGCPPADPEQFCIDNGYQSNFGSGECQDFTQNQNT